MTAAAPPASLSTPPPPKTPKVQELWAAPGGTRLVKNNSKLGHCSQKNPALRPLTQQIGAGKAPGGTHSPPPKL